MNESGVIDLRPMRGVLITPGLAANEPDRVEVHDKEPGEATDAWIRRAVGCDLYDVVVADSPAVRINIWVNDGIDIWVDDEGLLKELEPNMVASLIGTNPATGSAPMLVGRALIVPTQADGETRGFNHEIASVVANELASVSESLFSVWQASPQGQLAAMMMQAAREQEQNEDQEPSDAAG